MPEKVACPDCGASMSSVVVRDQKRCPHCGTFTELCPACASCIDSLRWLDHGECHECRTPRDVLFALREGQYERADLEPIGGEGPPYRFGPGQRYTAAGSTGGEA